jgi:hypothetical protein
VTNGTSSPCPCGDPTDPQVVSNPPGLGQIAYRVDDFTGFRRALLRPLLNEQAIGVWRPAPGDLGLQVLEWWAYLADILTFYNERIANESYLRTATQASSLANLVALIGYQPAPGIAATGNVAVTRTAAHPDEPLVIPPGMRISSVPTPGVQGQTFEVDGSTPASFSGVSSIQVIVPPSTDLAVDDTSGNPASVLLSGKVSGIKTGDQLLLVEKGFTGSDDNWSLVTADAPVPQTDPNTGAVNTSVPFSAGDWGPTAPPTPLTGIGHIGKAVTTASATILRASELGGEAPSPAAGLAGGPAVTAPSRPPTSVTGASRVAAEHLATGGTDLAEAAVAEFGSYFWHPGMPHKIVFVPPRQWEDYRLMRPVAAAALWNRPHTTSGGKVIGPASASGSGMVVHLSAAVRGIAPGDMVLFDGGAASASALGVVTSITEDFWTVSYPPVSSSHAVLESSVHIPHPTPSGSSGVTPPDIALAHTVLTVALAASDTSTLQGFSDLGAVAVRYGFKDVGTIIGTPQPTLKSLPTPATVPSAYTPPTATTTALLQDSTGAGVLVTFSAAGPSQVTLTGADSPPAAIPATAPLIAPLELLLDVVPVSRGTTVTNEVLGNGKAALINQSFTLAKSPLTYLASGDISVPALAVYVDMVRWQQVQSFYGQGASAKVYVVTRSPDQTVTTITFGDGINGARLTSGTGNVTATYRYGSGAASPPAGRLTTISQPQPNLASVQNPVAVSPGKDPQAPADVRANAPASVFTFGRAISAVDYEVIAGQAPGVSRVAAYWTFDGAEQRTMVTIYVGGDAAAASAALAGSDDPNRPVTVLSATPIALSLSATVVVDADYQVPAVVSAATAALADTDEGLFSPADMGIGQRLYVSAIDEALRVPGVVAVHDLTVTGAPVAGSEAFDPGTGAFFEPGRISIIGVSASD